MLALAGLGAVASGPAFSAMTVDSDGGVEVYDTENKDYWFKLGGRAFIDQVWFTGDDNDRTGFPSGSRISSARLNMKGGVGRNWVYRLELDFADTINNDGGSSFGEVMLGYQCTNWSAAVGQLSIPFGLENWESSSDLALMGNSLATNAFAPLDYGIGIYADYQFNMFTIAGMIYHPQAGTEQYGDFLAAVPGTTATASGVGSLPGSDTMGYAGRITFSPVHDKFTVYHAGFSARYEDLHDLSNIINLIAPLELRSRETPRLVTNIPPNSVENARFYDVELAGRWGPLLVTGEYMWADMQRPDAFYSFSGANDRRNPPGDLDYSGYYIQASYVLTGETREYDFAGGTFDRVRPTCPTGAWEIAARYSYVKLLDNPELALRAIDTEVDPNAAAIFVATGLRYNDIVGSAHAATLGVTWYANDNVRFMANYSRTDLPNDLDTNAFGLRAQVVF